MDLRRLNETRLVAVIIVWMAKAKDVAYYMVRLASAEEEPEVLTPLRLHKLLYYVQGWNLGINDKPMFEDRIEAWAHGPVVKPIYSSFKDKETLSEEIVPDSINLSAEEKNFTKSVWKAYRGYSAWSLRNMTHKEDPWKQARGNLPPEARSSAEITKAAMKKYFKKCAREPKK